MSFENSSSQLESQDEMPKLKEASKEEIQKVDDSIKYSNKLNKVNDVLNVLDFPDNKEESFRKVLEQQDNVILKDLASKSKKEILTFLIKEQTKKTESREYESLKIKSEEHEKQLSKKEKIESKVSKIKSIFTPDILNNNPDITEKLNSFDTLTEPQEKETVLKEILNILKQP